VAGHGGSAARSWLQGGGFSTRVGDCEREQVAKRRESGADFVGGEKTWSQKHQEGGWTDYRRGIATPDMIEVEAGKLGKSVGPRALDARTRRPARSH